MILMGNSRFPSPNMNVLFIKVILSYIQGAPMKIYTEQNYKRNTEHFQRYFSVTVQVIYQIIQNTIMDHFATEF